METGICKEMSGGEEARGYESHCLKPLIWWPALINGKDGHGVCRGPGAD